MYHFIKREVKENFIYIFIKGTKEKVEKLKENIYGKKYEFKNFISKKH